MFLIKQCVNIYRNVLLMMFYIALHGVIFKIAFKIVYFIVYSIIICLIKGRRHCVGQRLE